MGAQIQGFQQCTVTWEAPSAPLVDISGFERAPENIYGNTDTKADQTDAYVEPSNAKQTDAYVEPSNAQQTDAYVEPSNAKQTDAYVDPNAAQQMAMQIPKLSKLMEVILMILPLSRLLRTHIPMTMQHLYQTIQMVMLRKHLQTLFKILRQLHTNQSINYIILIIFIKN